jgi:phasin family protein
MFAFPEQFSNATKANLEAQFALFSALTAKTFEGMEKLVGLNISTAKSALEDSSANARQLLAPRMPRNSSRCRLQQAQPNAEKALSYNRQLAASPPIPAPNSRKPPKARSPKSTAR